MAPSAITPPPEEEVANVKKQHLSLPSRHKDEYSTADEAVGAARERFIARNQTSLKLHLEALKSMPGGNTRSLLHNAPFPVCEYRSSVTRIGIRNSR